VIDSSFAYCVPSEDWKRETIYLKARGVDYIWCSPHLWPASQRQTGSRHRIAVTPATVEMNSLRDQEPCPDSVLEHVMERTLHGKILQTKREILIRITRCHVVKSSLTHYCGWMSRADVVR
jgi:hypothetical protein